MYLFILLKAFVFNTGSYVARAYDGEYSRYTLQMCGGAASLMSTVDNRHGRQEPSMPGCGSTKRNHRRRSLHNLGSLSEVSKGAAKKSRRKSTTRFDTLR
jgi:hypothetical protein